jgi:GT2 family glycosyltransferase/tetratricopeptide (TPR) repeat protein
MTNFKEENISDREQVAVYLQEKKWQKAIALGRQVIEQNPQDYNCYYLVAQALANLGNWQEAVAAYQKTIELKPDYWEAYHHLGDAFINLKRWDEAVGAYQQAIKLNSNFAWSYYNLGIALINLQLWEEATPFFRQAVVVDANFALAYVYLGDALFQQKKWQEANYAYQQAWQLQPNLPNLEFKLAQTFKNSSEADLLAALFHYQQLLKKPSVNPEVYLEIAKILVRQDELSQALFYVHFAQLLDTQNTSFLQQLKLRRAKLYELTQEFSATDRDYQFWRKYNSPKLEDLQQMFIQVMELALQPLITIILPVDCSSLDFLPTIIESIRLQIYPYWQLSIIVESADHLQETLIPYSKQDSRIKIHFCQKKQLIAGINQSLKHNQTEWLALLQTGTLISPDALAEAAIAINKNTQIQLIYGDEDLLNPQGLLTQPWFKSDWCPDSLLAHNYFGSLVFFKHDLWLSLKEFNPNYQTDYDYDFWLRATEVTQEIYHITQIISHRYDLNKAHNNREREQVLIEALKRRKEVGKIIKIRTEQSDKNIFPEIYKICYQIKEYSLVTIIIPTKNLGEILNECLSSIFELTTYPNYEVIVIDNGSDEPETAAVINHWQRYQPEKFRCLLLDIPFNYSRLNNYAVSQTQGKYLLFLNNDTKVITPNWLEEMVAQAQRTNIGAVGGLLLYPDETIQHAGVILGVTGIAGHSHRHFPLDSPGYYQRLQGVNNYSAVTGACLMCRRVIFESVGGFNEKLAVAYNDVDLCLKISQQGYYNVVLPEVRLYHYESQSRSLTASQLQPQIKQEVDYMQKTWGELIDRDPCYSIHLTKEQEDYSLNLRQHNNSTLLRPQAEVFNITNLELNQEQLWGFFLDSPQIGYLKTNSVDIIGWILTRYSKAIALEVVYHDQIIARTEVNVQRPDVAKVYPQVEAANQSGFATTIKLIDLPSYAQLNLQTVLADQTCILLAKVQLRH